MFPTVRLVLENRQNNADFAIRPLQNDCIEGFDTAISLTSHTRRLSIALQNSVQRSSRSGQGVDPPRYIGVFN